MHKLDYEKYKCIDGSYESPKNGRKYNSLKAFIAHWHNNSTSGWTTANFTSKQCMFCAKTTSSGNLPKHQKSCYLNPNNVRLCKICDNPIKDYRHSKGTCSHSCSNIWFKDKRKSLTNYQSLCWKFHKKECIVCGERNIVAAHHYNNDHNDNRPENLVPLCPTHHQYVHSRFKEHVMNIVDNYVKISVIRLHYTFIK